MYANGAELYGAEPAEARCENVDQDIGELRQTLTRAGFRSVSHSVMPAGVDPGRPGLIQVSIDDNNTDCHIGVIYETLPDPHGGEHIYDAFADEYERFPLTDAPHHWFCESIGF